MSWKCMEKIGPHPDLVIVGFNYPIDGDSTFESNFSFPNIESE